MIFPKHLPVHDITQVLSTWETFGETLLFKILYRTLVVLLGPNVMVAPLMVVRGEKTTCALFVRDTSPAGQKVDNDNTVVYSVNRTVILDRRGQVPLNTVSLCRNLCLLPC